VLHHTVTGSGPAVVLVHAGVADGRMWDATRDALADSWTVVVPDLRGFGGSPMPPADAAPWTNAGDVLELLDHLGVAEAAVLGASYGGRVATELAATAPDRVTRLVLLAPAAAGMDPSESLRAFGDEEDALLEAGDAEGATALNVRAWLGPDASDEARRLLHDMQRLAFDIQLAADEEAGPQPVDADPARITAPTSVFVGAHDFPDFAEVARRLVASVPTAEMVELEWAGHLPALERPAEAAALVRDALARGVGPRAVSP
jgi:pimeloyl-ACP methyl ester carboxylesterase